MKHTATEEMIGGSLTTTLLKQDGMPLLRISVFQRKEGAEETIPKYDLWVEAYSEYDTKWNTLIGHNDFSAEEKEKFVKAGTVEKEVTDFLRTFFL